METITFKGVECTVLSETTTAAHLMIQNASYKVVPFFQKMITQAEYQDCKRGRPLKKAKGESFTLVDEMGYAHKTAGYWILCKQHQDRLEKESQHKNTKFKII